MTTKDNLATHQHRRYNPLTDEWVLVSPHRTQRPWQGAIEPSAPHQLPAYDAECYLCPGNRRANGEQNPQYSGTFWFQNDFAALRTDAPSFEYSNDTLVAVSEYGLCRVLCYSPVHNLHIADMSIAQITGSITLWQEQSSQCMSEARISHVQIFENRGSAMGASNPHPHAQLWANESIPALALRKATQQKRWLTSHHKKLLVQYLSQERILKQRIIHSNQHFSWVVPFWAVWPYETMIIPHRSYAHITECTEGEKESLAQILKTAVGTYNLLFNTPFPYSMALHAPPVVEDWFRSWQFHLSFYPPLLRSATIRKFMVGYELCAMPQRDITPEYAAKTLRGLI